ncbi:calcium/sodium antiporter [Kordiimonas aestuarii]|uniref:calcium/sodium antiporter n=1 Tax=Kordiimonas aestuarii TaxID=1005925 RepID=UPI0021D1668C|nr:calcium/sodium antiporter [Kordiimonas aestuarii]
MLLPVVAILVGLVVLVWSAGLFIDGAKAVAQRFGMSPLLIGMLVIGFGTSAPEMVVSGLSAAQGNPGLALGNAFGSNITNIALILGLTALVRPLGVHSKILRKELPVLAVATALVAILMLDHLLGFYDALILLAVFVGLTVWSVYEGRRHARDSFGTSVDQSLCKPEGRMSRSVVILVTGLVLLVASSQALVWGAVQIAEGMGISDVIIGLTVVAVGTSLPELASSVIAARKGDHEIAFGNVIGSNLFNTLAVTGIAGSIHAIKVDPIVLTRDVPVMGFLTMALFLLGFGFRGIGRINRLEGAFLLLCFAAYTAVLVDSALDGLV